VTHIIYALIDPNTHQVRYVGQTSKTPQERLQQHMYAARRNAKPVYDWIRNLAPAKPFIVVLQEVKNETQGRTEDLHYENTAASAETKWMKRFERYILNAIPRHSAAYQRLVNKSLR
jgi:hypothetical protein